MISSLDWLSRFPGRLVGEQYSRLLDERPCDAHALLLSAGKLSGLVIGSVSESDAIERVQGSPFSVGAVSVNQWKLDVGARCQPGEQVVGLKDESDLPTPYLREPVVGCAAYVLAIQDVSTARGDI